MAGACCGLLLLAAVLATRAAADTGVGAPWEGSGSPTATVVSDGSAADPVFEYQDTNVDSGAWSFKTTATESTTLTIAYDYSGYHAFFQVRVGLESYVVHNGVTEVNSLVAVGPKNCDFSNNPMDPCGAPSGGFSYTGKTALKLSPGDEYGFRMTGSHNDADRRLLGTLKLTLGNRPPRPEAQQLSVDSGDSLPIFLFAPDPEGDSTTYDIVNASSHGKLTGGGSNYTYTPAADYAGDDRIVYRATDSQGATATGRIAISVVAPSPDRQTAVEPPEDEPPLAATGGPVTGGATAGIASASAAVTADPAPVAAQGSDPASTSDPSPPAGPSGQGAPPPAAVAPPPGAAAPNAAPLDPDKLVNDNPERSDVAALFPRPDKLFLSARDIQKSVGISVLLLLMLGLPAKLFNKTVQKNRAELAAWFAPVSAAFTKITPGAARRLLEVAGVSAATAAAVYVFLDPKFPDKKGAAPYALGMLVAFGVIVTNQLVTWRIYVSRHVPEQAGGWTVYPGQIAVSVFCVVVSRIANFVPGLMFGMSGDYEPRGHLSREHAGRRVALSYTSLIVISLAAWFVSIPVAHAAEDKTAGFGVLMLDAALAVIAIGGMQTVAFVLVPLTFLDGDYLYRWNRGIWLGLWSIGVIWLALVIVNPALSHHSDKGASVGWLAGLLVFQALVSLGLWSYFVTRRRTHTGYVAGAH